MTQGIQNLANLFQRYSSRRNVAPDVRRGTFRLSFHPSASPPRRFACPPPFPCRARARGLFYFFTRPLSIAARKATIDSSQDHTIRVQQLFVRHQTQLKGFILSLQPEFAEADDILQEVFLVVTRKATEFKEGSNFIAWAKAIARLKILESKRQKKGRNLALSDQVIDALCEAAPDDRPDEDRLAAVQRCLDKLAPRLQDLVKRRYFVEQGPGEIARLISWTPNAVNVALSKARRQLQQCVGRRKKTS